VAVGAALRLAHWWAVRQAPFVGQLAGDAAEYDRWARTIAAGEWLGHEPFFQAPLYPYLLALLYRVAGPRLDVVYLFQIGLALVGLMLIVRTADRLLGPPHGLVAGLIGALYLPAVFHEVQIAKEGPALVLVAWLLDRLTAAWVPGTRVEATGGASAANEPLSRRGAWLSAGVALGLLGLLRENALLMVVFLLPLTLAPSGAWRANGRRAAWFLVGLVLPLLPVAARNAAVGGGFLPTTFQGGVNLWIGNNPEADGTYHPVVAGKQVPSLERAEARRLAEQASGRSLTGAEVSSYWLGRVVDWARRDPSAFVRLQIRKLALYLTPYEWPDTVDYAWMKTISRPLAMPGIEWGGLVPLAIWGAVVSRRRRRALTPVLLFELGWLLSTVAFFLFSRYRLPAAPGLFLLAAPAIVTTGEAWRQAGLRGRGAPLVRSLAILAAIFLPWIAAPKPRVELVEFNLGRLAEEAGDLAAAGEHYRAAFRADPEFALAAMNLGLLASRAGHLDVGLEWLQKAVEIEPRSDDAWANLGAARLAAGDLPGARSALEQALALNPQHPAATRNLELLARGRDDP